MRAAGLPAFQATLRELVPAFADRVDELRDWSQVPLLTVEANRLRRWHRPGPLRIGGAARARYLAAQYPTLERRWLAKAAASEDAFDAAVSALVMARHASSFASLGPTADAVRALEGSIWLPPAERVPAREQVAAVTRDFTVATFVVRGDTTVRPRSEVQRQCSS